MLTKEVQLLQRGTWHLEHSGTRITTLAQIFWLLVVHRVYLDCPWNKMVVVWVATLLHGKKVVFNLQITLFWNKNGFRLKNHFFQEEDGFLVENYLFPWKMASGWKATFFMDKDGFWSNSNLFAGQRWFLVEEQSFSIEKLGFCLKAILFHEEIACDQQTKAHCKTKTKTFKPRLECLLFCVCVCFC